MRLDGKKQVKKMGAVPVHKGTPLTLLGPQSRFGDKSLGIRVVCPQIGTAVLRGLMSLGIPFDIAFPGVREEGGVIEMIRALLPFNPGQATGNFVTALLLPVGPPPRLSVRRRASTRPQGYVFPFRVVLSV